MGIVSSIKKLFKKEEEVKTQTLSPVKQTVPVTAPTTTTKAPTTTTTSTPVKQTSKGFSGVVQQVGTGEKITEVFAEGKKVATIYPERKGKTTTGGGYTVTEMLPAYAEIAPDVKSATLTFDRGGITEEINVSQQGIGYQKRLTPSKEPTTPVSDIQIKGDIIKELTPEQVKNLDLTAPTGERQFLKGTTITPSYTPDILYKDKLVSGEAGFFGKMEDLWVSGLAGVGLTAPLRAGSDIKTVYGGMTGQLSTENYIKQAEEIQSEYWKSGGIFNPLAGIKAFQESKTLREQQRLKTAELQNVLISSPYTDFTLESRQKSLVMAGYSPFDINIKTISETTPYKYTDIWGGTTEGFTTTTTKYLETPSYVFTTVPFAEAGLTGSYKPLILSGTTQIASIGLKGLALSGLGVTGGFATEGGLVGQSATTIIGYVPKTAKILDFAMKPVVMLTGVGLVGARGAYVGYKSGEQVGLNPFVTSIISGTTDIGKVYSFTAGASAGDISPIKAQTYQLQTPTGKIKELTTVSIGEPFSRKYTALFSRFEGQTYLGYAPRTTLAGLRVSDIVANQQAFGTAEGEALIKYYGKTSPEYKIVTSTVGTLRGKNIENPDINLMNQKTFSQLSKPQQLQWTKEMQQLGGEPSATGFRKFTGSISGVYGRQAGDIDVALGARANAQQIAKDIAGRMGAGFTSNAKGQIFFQGTKVFEGLTPINAIPQPLGYFGRYPQATTLSGTKTLVNPAGQSLTELGSAIRYPAGFTSTGELTFGVDKTQRIADFATTAQKLALSSGKKFDIGTFKSVYGAKYPNINWEAGQVVTTAGTVPSVISVPSISSITASVFLPRSASSTSANIRAFIPPKVSSSTFSRPSILSVSSFVSRPSPSASSFSSRSSSISSSSVPSRSSISSSSISSLSSISSSSSVSSIMSSLSSSSSSSSISSSISSSSSSSVTGFTVPPPPFIPFPFYAGEMFGGAKSIKSKRKYGYTPSFKALVFGIKKVGKAPAPTTKFTGLEVRPIYVSKTRKKKKK